MSIRMIARDLYRFRREVERLEKEVKDATSEKGRGAVVELLRKARAEENRLQRMLDGAKEPPSYRRPL